MWSPPEPYAISWFGWDICDFELITDSDFRRWELHLGRLAVSLGMRIERFGNPIDVIIGKLVGSVYPREFFFFQNRWDELNEQFGFRMSGVLWLTSLGGDSHPTIWEIYQRGRKIAGDSIGRPARHSLSAVRAKEAKKRQGSG